MSDRIDQTVHSFDGTDLTDCACCLILDPTDQTALCLILDPTDQTALCLILDPTDQTAHSSDGTDQTDCACCLTAAVAQWLRCCATVRKVAGSIPASVSGFFIDIKSFRSHYGPGVDSASNRNEYQEYFLGVKAASA